MAPSGTRPECIVDADSGQLFQIVQVAGASAGALVGLEVVEADEMQRQAIVDEGLPVRPGGVEIDAVDVRQQVDAKRRIQGHSIFAYHLIDKLGKTNGFSTASQIHADVKVEVQKEYPQEPQIGGVASAGHSQGGDYLFLSR